jgi:hypothetical protein
MHTGEIVFMYNNLLHVSAAYAAILKDNQIVIHTFFRGVN